MNYDILAEYIEPGRAERKLPAPDWALDSPVGRVIRDIAHDGMLYRHQSLALEKLAGRSNLVISTGTASGKTLIFQIATLDILAKNPDATAIAIYPIKALSRDQLIRWKETAPKANVPAESINKIDGDVPTDERQDLLQNSRIALMTPDIVHRWLLNYSDSNMRTASPSVNQTKRACREFIRNLSCVIIDEAHTYETTFGANMAYLIRRLRARKRLLNPSDPEPLFIAASATILNPTQHLEQLTGLRFAEITEEDNGSPKSPLTVQHILGRTLGMGSEQDMIELIGDLVKEDRDGSYIAFADDRQKVERIASGIEPTGLIHEEDIINESTISMPYRSGLQARALIEQRLKDGSMRGVVSTSALEMGIDIPELKVGINLGIPNNIKRSKQRAGRVGRRTPGRFIIVEEEYAFQFDPDGLRGYWSREPEPANLHLTNRFIQRIQADCLRKEIGNAPLPNMNWPEGFTAAAQSGQRGEPYTPDTGAMRGTQDKQWPHQSSMRSVQEKDIAAYIREEPQTPLTTMSKIEAMKELYTWATYHHAKQAYRVLEWNEDGTEANTLPHVVITLSKGEKPRTRRIMETRAEVREEGSQIKRSDSGFIGYADNGAAKGMEVITGASHWAEDQNRKMAWLPYRYAEHHRPEIERAVQTNMTFLAIEEEWFAEPATKEAVVNALKDIMCHMDNVAPEEIMTAHSNVTVETEHGNDPQNVIALWDRAAGGLGLSKTMYDKLPEYTARLLEIAEDPTRAPDSSLPLPLTTARRLQIWTERLPTEESSPPQGIRPIQTVYNGVTFRSQLEARWAAHFEKNNIPWDYEPTAFVNWLPDFRIHMNGEETYAEVKPVEEFPPKVAEKIDQSAWQGQAAILGRDDTLIWTRHNGQWTTGTE